MAGNALAAPVGPTYTLIDDEEDCLEAVLAAASVTSVTDEGQEITLEAHVLLDDVDLQAGTEMMATAAEVYAPLGIKLVSRFEPVDFPPEDVVNERETTTSDKLLEQSKEWMGGARPSDSDVVYLITAKNMTDAAGRADCIGGVRYPRFAFAVGEVGTPLPFGPVAFYTEGGAKIAAHEIGHLMGAHHHYGNCAEGQITTASNGDPAMCTTMFPFLDFVTLRFGSLEAAVIRGHALEFAADTPKTTPTVDREVKLELKGHLVARGRVIVDRNGGCAYDVPVEVQRLRGGSWETFHSTSTDKTTAAYSIKLPDRAGRYRAYLQQTRSAGGEWGTEYCASALSPVVAHSH